MSMTYADCPKCKGYLQLLKRRYDWENDIENETWECLECSSSFNVKSEMVRDWTNLTEEVEK